MTIRLMHHDPRWKQEFEQTRSGILQCCEGRVTSVQHIGGTAISGLISQPIIDIVASLDRVDDRAEATLAIEGMNLRVVDSPSWAGGATTLEKPRHGEVTHRVFLVDPDDSFSVQAVRLRDFLRSNPEVAIRFEETKVKRWKRGEGEPEPYAADKAVFFTHLLDQLTNR